MSRDAGASTPSAAQERAVERRTDGRFELPVETAPAAERRRRCIKEVEAPHRLATRLRGPVAKGDVSDVRCLERRHLAQLLDTDDLAAGPFVSRAALCKASLSIGLTE